MGRRNKKPLKQRMRGSHGCDYLCFTAVQVRDGVYTRKDYSVHQAVAAAFLGPKPEGLIVLHGPNGKFDNRPENLSYGTHSQNALDKHRDGTMPDLSGEKNPAAKLTDEQVAEIRALKGTMTQAAIGERFGITFQHVSKLHAGARRS